MCCIDSAFRRPASPPKYLDIASSRAVKPPQRRERRRRFDDRGLWSHKAVWFFRYGTLLATVEAFVNRSANGYYASELADELKTAILLFYP